MKVFQAKPRRWGQSYGVVIPAEVFKKEKLSTKKAATFMLLPPEEDIWSTMGTLKFPKKTSELLKEARKGEPHA